MRTEPNIVLAQMSRKWTPAPRTAVVDLVHADGTVRKVEVVEVDSGGQFISSDGTRFVTA
jgi:hypothetical protein